MLGFTPIQHRLNFRESLPQHMYFLHFLLNFSVNLRSLLRNGLMKKKREREREMV